METKIFSMSLARDIERNCSFLHIISSVPQPLHYLWFLSHVSNRFDVRLTVYMCINMCTIVKSLFHWIFCPLQMRKKNTFHVIFHYIIDKNVILLQAFTFWCLRISFSRFHILQWSYATTTTISTRELSRK